MRLFDSKPMATGSCGGHRFLADTGIRCCRTSSPTVVGLVDTATSPASVWRSAEAALPEVARLAGTFPDASGPNCFGSVMAAAGVAGAEAEWMMRQPFEEWLARSTAAGGRDENPGTVLVWRSAEGAEHAAVTLGGGWAFHKPSQGWMSPRVVLTAADVVRSSRAQGLRLSRRRLLS